MMCRCAGYRYAGLVAVLACLIWMALAAVAVKFAGPDGAAGMGVSLHSSMDKLFEYLWHKQQVPPSCSIVMLIVAALFKVIGTVLRFVWCVVIVRSWRVVSARFA